MSLELRADPNREGFNLFFYPCKLGGHPPFHFEPDPS